MFFFNSQTSFLDNSSQLHDSPASHIAVDRRLGEASSSRDVELSLTLPYFPRGLARSENITDFNFNLFLYDSLRLPYGLFPGDLTHEVQFDSLQACREYCARFVAEKQEQCRQQRPSADHSEQRRRELSKETMFEEAGSPLGVNLKCGNEQLDRNLDKVRLDMYGNVMILNAPHWSDISAQFMHGFPRRLITDHHRGVLIGNITVAARISNQAVRSLATGDIASFISKRMVQGLGLTTTELVLARTSAIRYAGKSGKPARLINMMVRFGVDFLTMTPLGQVQLQGLRESSFTHWQHMIASTSDAEVTDSSSDESEISLDWDLAEEIESLPEYGTDEHTQTVMRHVDNLVHCYVSVRRTTQELQVSQEVAQSRRSGSSGMTRQRKQPRPRRVASSTSQVSTAPATTSASTAPSASTIAANQAEGSGGDQQQERPSEVAQPPSARELLLQLPGIVGSRIPNEQSLERLKQFLTINQPCDPAVIANAVQVLRETPEEARQKVAREQCLEECGEQVRHGMREVWRVRKNECTCTAQAVSRPSQGDKDSECPFCICDEDGADIITVSEKCQNEAECDVCTMMNQLDPKTLTGLGMKRNKKLTAMLQLAPSIARSLNSGEVAEDRRQVLYQAFCELLSCKKTKLRYVANVGFLTMLCPNLKLLHLQKGCGDAWCNLSKIATAVGYHNDHRSQIAALMFMRQKCVTQGNHWSWFLQSEDLAEEQRIDREVFQATSSHGDNSTG